MTRPNNFLVVGGGDFFSFEIITTIFLWWVELTKSSLFNYIDHKFLIYKSTINLFFFKNIQRTGSNFYMIRKYVNLRTFFIPENWFADKNQLFPCQGRVPVLGGWSVQSSFVITPPEVEVVLS